VAKEFAKLLNATGLRQRGRGFYSLRHTFATISGRAKDETALRHIMGHVDGSMLAHLSRPDMRLPIAAALYHPSTVELPWERLDLASAGRLDFFAPDSERFPAIDIARRAQAMGGTIPAVLNAANEVAVEAFLAGRILFPEIVAVSARLIEETSPEEGAVTIDSILAADSRARIDAGRIVAEYEESGRI
jgi:1-deoxy-D-xylulose-5-phosphate reductoisomerase